MVVGDASMPACYLFAHGVVEAFYDASALHYYSYIGKKAILKDHQKRKLSRYKRTTDNFNKAISFLQNHPNLSMLYTLSEQYGDYTAGFQKPLAIASLGGAALCSIYGFYNGDGYTRLLENVALGLGSGFVAGAGFVGCRFFQRIKAEEVSLKEPGTVISFQ